MARVCVIFRSFADALLAACAACIIAPAFAQTAADDPPPATTSPVVATPGLRGLALAPHIALLLPMRSPDYARASEAVRNGVLAARDVLMPDMEIVVHEAGDTAEETQAAYRSAAQASPVAIIGPLTRPAVQAISSAVEVLTPTVALNAIDAAVPPNVVMFALLIESEAQQVARLAIGDLRVREPGRQASAVVITSAAPLHRRAAQAFGEAFASGGGTVLATIDAASDRGAALQSRLASAAPALVFLAVDAGIASTVRPYLRDVPAYGTSQLNARADRLRLYDLEGVHLVDMPWLVQRAAPAVSRFARSEELARYSADLERLYAMGIDAFRLALDAATGRASSGFDGVTGALRLEQQRVERRAMPAIFRDGEAVADGQ